MLDFIFTAFFLRIFPLLNKQRFIISTKKKCEAKKRYLNILSKKKKFLMKIALLFHWSCRLSPNSADYSFFFTNKSHQINGLLCQTFGNVFIIETKLNAICDRSIVSAARQTLCGTLFSMLWAKSRITIQLYCMVLYARRKTKNSNAYKQFDEEAF